MITKLRPRLTYANVMATAAVFIALGGSSYAALTLPRNSVGPAQIRSRAVVSRHIRDGAIALRDISAGARASLRGRQGPAGPAGTDAVGYRARVDGGGGLARGNSTGVDHAAGTNEYRVHFNTPSGAPPIETCIGVAGPAGGTPGFASADPTTGGQVVVHTFGTDGSPRENAFELIVTC